MHTRYVYMYTNINLQEKYRQRAHSKFKFQQIFGITEQMHFFHVTSLKASHHIMHKSLNKSNPRQYISIVFTFRIMHCNGMREH